MSVDSFEITVGTLLLVGIWLSFTPQYYRIVKKQSSEGLSPWYLFIGTAGTFASVSNALIFYWPELENCSGYGTTRCYHEILGFCQLLTLWVSFYGLFLLFIKYLKKSDYQTFYESDSESGSDHDAIFGKYPEEHQWCHRRDHHRCASLVPDAGKRRITLPRHQC